MKKNNKFMDDMKDRTNGFTKEFAQKPLVKKVRAFGNTLTGKVTLGVAGAGILATVIAVPIVVSTKETNGTKENTAINVITTADFEKKFPQYIGKIVNNKVIDDAFKNDKTLPSDFKLPNSITDIGNNTFDGAQLPAGFTLPNSLTSVGTAAFANTVLPDGLNLPETMTSIGAGAFTNAHLPSSFLLPSSIYFIADHAFESATLPEHFTLINTAITSIGSDAFAHAILPANFSISSKVLTIDRDAFKDATTQVGYIWKRNDGVVVDGPTESGYSYRVAELTVADFEQMFPQYRNKIVGTKVIEQAFSSETLPDGFQLPHSVTELGKDAFTGAALSKGFALPNLITSIGVGAFQSATNFSEGFTLANNKITSLANNAFSYVNLPKGFALPNSLISIDESAFDSTELPKGFEIPASVKKISSGAFIEATFPEGFTIPKSINFEDYAFDHSYVPDGCFWYLNFDGKFIRVEEPFGSGHEYKVMKATDVSAINP